MRRGNRHDHDWSTNVKTPEPELNTEDATGATGTGGEAGQQARQMPAQLSFFLGGQQVGSWCGYLWAAGCKQVTTGNRRKECWHPAGNHEGHTAVRHSKRPEPELNQEDTAGG